MTGSVMAANIVFGIAFDRIGPRVVGIAGSFIALTGYILWAFAVMFPCDFSWGVWFTSLSYLGGGVSQLVVLSYFYLLPNHKFVVAAAAAAVAPLGNAFNVATVQSIIGGHISFSMVLLILAFGSLLASVACLTLVPDKATFSAIKSALAAERATQSHGGALASEAGASTATEKEESATEATGGDGACAKEARLLRDWYVLFVHTDAWGHAGYAAVVHLFACLNIIAATAINQYLYMRSTFGEHYGNWLLNRGFTINAAWCAPSALLIGVLSERFFGPIGTMMLLDALLAGVYINLVISTPISILLLNIFYAPLMSTQTMCVRRFAATPPRCHP